MQKTGNLGYFKSKTTDTGRTVDREQIIRTNVKILSGSERYKYENKKNKKKREINFL
jgi:hypothetical protein